MSKKQTLFLLQLMHLVEESLGLNRYLLKTIQDGPMGEEAHKEAMERFNQIEERFAK